MGQRRTFPRGSKVAAVKLVTERGRRFAAAARSLGVSGALPRTRTKTPEAAAAQAFPGRGPPPPAAEELRRLRAGNKRLLMDRDILRKAAAFFARAPP
jgi:transposase